MDVQIERLLAAASQARTQGAFAAATSDLKQLPLDRQVEVAVQILKINENLAVYLMQDALLASDQFEGPATGQLDLKTIRAILRACRSNADNAACARPLSTSFIQAILPSNWTG